MEPQTIRLPDVVRFAMPAQHAVVILEALNKSAVAPYETTKQVVMNFEQQLIGQQIVPQQPPKVEAVPETIDALDDPSC